MLSSGEVKSAAHAITMLSAAVSSLPFHRKNKASLVTTICPSVREGGGQLLLLLCTSHYLNAVMILSQLSPFWPLQPREEKKCRFNSCWFSSLHQRRNARWCFSVFIYFFLLWFTEMDVLLEICRHLIVNMSCLPGEYDTSSVVTSSYPYLKDVPHLEYSHKIVIFLWRQTSGVSFVPDSFLNFWSLLLWNRSSEYTGHVLNK